MGAAAPASAAPAPAEGAALPYYRLHTSWSTAAALCQVLAVGAAAAQAPALAPSEALPCPAPGAAQPLLGGYSPLDPQAAPELTQQLAPLAWQAYAGRNALSACPAGSAKLTSASVQRACRQARVISLSLCTAPCLWLCAVRLHAVPSFQEAGRVAGVSAGDGLVWCHLKSLVPQCEAVLSC